MNYRKINFMLFSILTIILFFSIPYYNHWLYEKIFNQYFLDDLTGLDEGDRNMKRFGYSYSVFSDIKKVLAHQKNVVMLLPPNDLVLEKNVGDLLIPEPAVFYYFTGFKSIPPNSPEAPRANWVLIPRGPGDVIVKKMENISKPDSLIAKYRKYKK